MYVNICKSPKLTTTDKLIMTLFALCAASTADGADKGKTEIMDQIVLYHLFLIIYFVIQIFQLYHYACLINQEGFKTYILY